MVVERIRRIVRRAHRARRRTCCRMPCAPARPSAAARWPSARLPARLLVEQFVDSEIALQLEVRPVIQRIAQTCAARSRPRRGIFRTARPHRCRSAPARRWPASRATCSDRPRARSRTGCRTAGCRDVAEAGGSDSRESARPRRARGRGRRALCNRKSSWMKGMVAVVYVRRAVADSGATSCAGCPSPMLGAAGRAGGPVASQGSRISVRASGILTGDRTPVVDAPSANWPANWKRATGDDR